jgi:site-specific recombinase XerD
MSSALVRSGFDIDQLQSLAQLVEIQNFERAMIWYHDHLGGLRPSLEELAHGMVAMAQDHIKVPDTQLDELRAIRDELRCRRRGMTDKNRDRLRQFKDPLVLRHFLGLGDQLIELAGKAKSEKKAAILMQKALMHEMLLWAPMRIENLVNLHLDRHIVRNDGGHKGAFRIVIPADEVKNGIQLEYILPMQIARLLERYLLRDRPALLNGPDEGWLFVSSQRAKKHKATIQQQITSIVLKHAGIKVNPHLYRHIAAFLHLKRHPDDIETVRRILGHKRIETTLMFYAELDQDLANMRYIEGILATRLSWGDDGS